MFANEIDKCFNIVSKRVYMYLAKKKKRKKKKTRKKKRRRRKERRKLKRHRCLRPHSPSSPPPFYSRYSKHFMIRKAPNVRERHTVRGPVFFVCCTFQYPDLSLEGAATRCPADLCVAHPIIKAVRSTVEVAIKFHLLPPNFIIPIVHNCSHELFIRGGRDDERAPPLRGLNNNELRISIRIFSMKNDEKDTYIYIYEILYICISIQ